MNHKLHDTFTVNVFQALWLRYSWTIDVSTVNIIMRSLWDPQCANSKLKDFCLDDVFAKKSIHSIKTDFCLNAETYVFLYGWESTLFFLQAKVFFTCNLFLFGYCPLLSWCSLLRFDWCSPCVYVEQQTEAGSSFPLGMLAHSVLRGVFLGCIDTYAVCLLYNVAMLIHIFMKFEVSE